MWVVLAAALFWMLTGVVTLRMASIGRDASSRSSRACACALLALGALLLFRPHEDIFGGQDGGAYLNTAARLARDPHLSYVDPLLAEAPPAARGRFLYYGFERPYLSKYACGRVKDFERAVCGVWFQPTYPIVAALPAQLLGLRAIFHVVPLFALLSALALGALARRMWPGFRGIGETAALLYLLNPLTVWHARHARPEIIAAFCVLAGAVLLIRAWQQGDARSTILDTALGALCIGVAPFFHIIAWMIALPAAGIVALAILSGRRVFLLYPIIAYVCLRLFILQLALVNDTYGLLRRLPWLATHVPAQNAVFAVAFAVLTLLSLAATRWKQLLASIAASMRAITALALVTGYTACWVLARLHPPSKDWPPAHFFMYRTDLNAVLNMVSRPAAALALAGALVMAARRTPAGVERRAILWLLAPATMLLGNLYDFFLTRYLMVAFIPLFSLALASLPTLIPERLARRSCAFVMTSCALLAVVLLHNRTHLVQTTEYRGLTAFIRNTAQPILRENGLLLFEYPRLAAPFDLMFGVPTLPLHNERDTDYAQQEHAWADIMRRFPNRPAFFITPFQPPRSDLFLFTFVGDAAYQGQLLAQNRWDLPTEVLPWNVTLRVYRMALASTMREPALPSLPNVYAFGDGNMGIRRFARVPQKPRETDGIPLASDQAISLPLPSLENAAAFQHALAFFATTARVPNIHITVEGAGAPVAITAAPLVAEWYLAFIPTNAMAAGTAALRLSTDTPALLHDILLLTTNRCVSLLTAMNFPGRRRLTLQPLHTRWARQNASVCVPTPENAPAFVLVFHTAPDELSEPLRVTARAASIPQGFTSTMPPGRWMWTAWPLAAVSPPRWEWVTFRAQPAFDPQMQGYPSDLITHLGWVCVVPAATNLLASDKRTH
jgi:hypothetical protein